MTPIRRIAESCIDARAVKGDPNPDLSELVDR
jgi:hypothetical protein